MVVLVLVLIVVVKEGGPFLLRFLLKAKESTSMCLHGHMLCGCGCLRVSVPEATYPDTTSPTMRRGPSGTMRPRCAVRRVLVMPVCACKRAPGARRKMVTCPLTCCPCTLPVICSW